MADVLNDYEQSFIGNFITSLFQIKDSLSDSSQLSMSVTKFEEEKGYSLV
jgi:hypothetical protein